MAGLGHPRPLPGASSNCARRDPQPCQAPGEGVLRVTSVGAGHSCPAIAMGWGGCSAGGGVPAPLGDGAGRSVSLQQGGENPGSTRAPGQSAPLWKVVPRRVVKGLPRAAPGEGVPSLPLEGPGGPSGSEATLPQEARCRGYTHKAHALCTPTGGHMGMVCRSLPRLPTVRQRQSLSPGGLPGFAAPAVPSLSLRRVSGPGAPWERPRKPLPASLATGPRPRDRWMGKLRQGLWWGVGEPPCCTSRWNWVNPGVSPFCSPLTPPLAAPPMLPRRGSAEARSFPKPCLRCLPPFADFIQKQVKEAVERGG